MFSNSICLLVRFHLRPLLLILFLIAEQGWAALPVNAAANEAPFRIMMPLMLMTAPASVPEATPEEQVLTLTNTLRQQHGCPTLQISPELTNAARGHSQDMADHNYFDHADGNGNTPKWRAQQAGYRGNAGTENIAAGYSTAQEVVMAWYNETPPNDGHRLNLLNCSLTDIGIGYAVNPNSTFRNYWTQDFGQR
jgi:uncharacterized protein YkwD